MLARTLIVSLLGYVLAAHTGDDMSQFVVRQGSSLKLGGSPWRFSGMNMYWLGLDENCVPPKTGKCIEYPTEFRTRDALETAVALGANVVRAHSLGVSSGDAKSLEHEKGKFNSNAFVPIDYAVSVAKELGIRLIVPLTDNYDYYHGGFGDYVRFEGGNCNWRPKHVPEEGDDCRAFFDHNAPTGDAVIADFKDYIKMLLTHVNQYTGVALKDEISILAWETGNEFQIKSQPFANWTEEIAVHIKESLGAKQLVLDGRDEIGRGVDQDALHSTPHVDMFTDHFYESASSAASKVAKDSAFAQSAEKVYTVGEYGPASYSLDDLRSFLSTLQQSSAVAGDAWWSFFPHGDNYGFVPHGDPYTMPFPGKDSAMQKMMLTLREHAFTMRGLTVPSDTDSPGKPEITVADGKYLAWRGATLAVDYDVEVSQSSSGPWQKICDRCISDHDTPWEVPAALRAADGGYYRVRGYSLGGTPGPFSNTTTSSMAADNVSWPIMSSLVESNVSKVSRPICRDCASEVVIV